jgi:5-methyltetrahydropteroyltriglutamate--homocysteine methyltransferase
MPIPTEPVGSIPSPPQLLQAMGEAADGQITAERLTAIQEEAVAAEKPGV